LFYLSLVVNLGKPQGGDRLYLQPTNPRNKGILLSMEPKNGGNALDWFEEVCAAQERSRGGKHSVMTEFRAALKMILTKAADPVNRERITLIGNQPALRVGSVANSLKQLFPFAGEEAYNRSYRYLRGMQKTLEDWGWVIDSFEDKKHLVLTDPKKFQDSISPSPPSP